MELEDALDPERLMQCPYNKHHQIRASRFPYHLVKCKKNYPDIAKELATCPFNARHLVPRADLSNHLTKCNDRGFIEQDIVNQSTGFQRKQLNAVSTWQAPPCAEDWETVLVPPLKKRIACLQDCVPLSSCHTPSHGKADPGASVDGRCSLDVMAGLRTGQSLQDMFLQHLRFLKFLGCKSFLSLSICFLS
ncbi:gametocyte-specific factor 1 isoform X2 [Apus apus]|uniref:gametocyte-specific factor 1 isoform X2 n=1 Tax=Apus apus TaxID=8895 RepID=UPI0021F8BCB1|nr:gametocyte-specific factor 1 isoform X2 [Apus apus]